MLLMLLSIIFEFNFLSDTFSSVEDNSHDLALFCNTVSVITFHPYSGLTEGAIRSLEL